MLSVASSLSTNAPRLCFFCFFFAPVSVALLNVCGLCFSPPVDKSGDFAHRATEHVNGLVDNMLLASAFLLCAKYGALVLREDATLDICT